MTKRVLIADDDEDMRELLRMALSSEDYTVVGAAVDGAEALEMWRRERDEGVCVVILDQRMPGLYGIDVALAIRQEDPEQRVLLLSAYIDETTQAEALDAGVAACIPKEDVLFVPRHPVLLAACVD